MAEQTARLHQSGVIPADDLRTEFEVRLGENSTLAFRVAFSVLHNRQDAEDVAQDALVRAFRAFRQLRAPDRFRSWLVRVTWRLALDHRRKEKRRSIRESAQAADHMGPTDAYDPVAQERSARLLRAIDALPEKLRIVTVLASIEEHDLETVARLLDLPAGTVKSRLFNGRRRLKELLT